MESDIASNEDIDQIIQKNFQILVRIKVSLDDRIDYSLKSLLQYSCLLYYPNGFDNENIETLSTEIGYDYVLGETIVNQNQGLCLEFGYFLAGDGQYEELLNITDQFLIDNNNFDYCEKMFYINEYLGGYYLSYRIKTDPNKLPYNEQDQCYNLNIQMLYVEPPIPELPDDPDLPIITP